MTTATKKITKKDYYEALDAIINAVGADVDLSAFEGMTTDGIHEFIAHEIELLNSKAAAAQKRAADKKIAGDELREKVFGVLTSEAQTIDAIVAAVGDPDVSRNMVTSRLTQLCAAGVERAVKEDVKVNLSDGKTKTVSGYRLA